MKRTMMIAMLSACVIALGTACGDDGGEGGNNTGGTGGTTGGSGGTAGDAGEGGSGGSDSGGSGGSDSGGTGGTTGGAGGMTGGSGGMMAGPIMCDDVECPASTTRGLVTCCVDDGNVCGQRIQGFGRICAAPVEPHPDCEQGSISGLGGSAMMIPSCCTPDGACGLVAPLLDLECTSNEEIIEMMTPDGGVDGGTSDAGVRPGRPMIVPGTPATCTP
jgi:hypothetical protein